MEAERPHLGALLGLAALACLFTWWAWKDGAYFGTVFLPGTVAVCAVVVVLARGVPWEIDPRRRRLPLVALGALIALGLWSALSALWSPAPDTAITDGQRILVYAVCFGCGMWFGALLGRRSELGAAPLAIAGGVAGAVTVVVMLTGDDPRSYLEGDGTLDYPLGYRNANAAFFAVALFPAVGLASMAALDWRLRGVSLGMATLCASMFLYCQSRAALPALAVATLVFLLAAPQRLRALVALGLAVLPALATLPAAIALHDTGSGGILDATDELRDAGTTAALAAAAAVAIGALIAFVDRRRSPGDEMPRRSNRAVTLGIAATLAVGAVGFVAAVGDPIGWADDRLGEFRETGTPDLSAQSTRFSVNLGSERYDLWRVALDEAGADPLLGTGGGGYEYAYMRDREAKRPARDAHSIEMEVLSELGIPGIALLTVTLAAATIAILAARRRGPAAAALAAVALGSGTYWLLHSSVDWFWPYPAITAPVLALAGAACTVGARATGPRPIHLRGRLPVLAAVAVLALSSIPFLLAHRYVNNAFAHWRSDLDRAYADLDRARALNPFTDEPWLAEGVIARASGDRERALDAVRAALVERREEWASHYLVAVMTLRDDRAGARTEAAEALRLNPLSDRTRGLAERLDIPLPPLPDSE